MNRRAFAAFTAFGFALPLVAGSSRADALEKSKDPSTKPDSPTQGSGLSADEVVARVEAFYAQVTSFKASFKQGNIGLPGSKKTTFDGSVIFEKPGKMSWRYAASRNRVVSDGSLIKVYERESKQLYEQELEQSQYPVALSFLGTQGKFTQNFKFSRIDAELLNITGSHVLRGEPLQHSAAYERLHLYVDARTYQVRRVVLTDARGNRNRFDFFRSRVNPLVPRGEFSFSPPPNTRIIRG